MDRKYLNLARAFCLLDIALDDYNDCHNDDNTIDIELVSKAYSILYNCIRIDNTLKSKIIEEINHCKHYNWDYDIQ